MLLAKCCHDFDFLLWITRSPCRKLSSFGSLRWFRAANAPQTSAERCIDCPVEHDCPYSAVDLYCTRRDLDSRTSTYRRDARSTRWLLEELRHGPYGRCIYRCDNDVVDHQLLTMELADETILSLSMDIFTQDDCRRTHIKMTHGEIFGDERKLHVHRFRQLLEIVDAVVAAAEAMHVELAFVAEDLAVRHLDVGAPAVVLREDVIESERDRLVREFHGEQLVVDHVVVAAVDAAAVGAVAQFFQEHLVERASLRYVEVRDPVAARAVEVDGRIGAVVLHRTVDAAFGARLRCVGCAEPAQRTERTEFAAGASGDPEQEIDVVAALGQQHRVGGLFAPPGAADVAVRRAVDTHRRRRD